MRNHTWTLMLCLAVAVYSFSAGCSWGWVAATYDIHGKKVSQEKARKDAHDVTVCWAELDRLKGESK